MCSDEKSSLIFFLRFNFSWNHSTNLGSSSPFFSQHATYFSISSVHYLCPLLHGILRSLHMLSPCPYSSDAQFYLFAKHRFWSGFMRSHYVHGCLNVASRCDMAQIQTNGETGRFHRDSIFWKYWLGRDSTGNPVTDLELRSHKLVSWWCGG